MEKQTSVQFNEQIRQRTLQASVEVHNLFLNVKVPSLSRPVVNQLIRCSSSVAANYRAATRSRSDSEFLSKICIVVEECDETQFWLEYLARTGVVTETEVRSIKSEVDQLIRLFTSIKKKMQEKLGR